MDGCSSSRGGAAGGLASLCCFFRRSPLPLEPCLTSSAGNNPVGVPFLGAGSGLSLWPSLEQEAGPGLLLPQLVVTWGKLCQLPALLHPPGWLGSRGNVLEAPARAHSHPWERRGSRFLWERLCLAGFSSPFPSGTHSGISRALSEHCLQHLLPRQGPDLCQDF